MSTETQASKTYTKISGLINSKRFNEAFLLLKNGLKNYANLHSELKKIQDLENNYRYMLDYIAEGNPDPSQSEMTEQMKDSMQRANDLLLREKKLVDSGDSYSSTKRLHKVRNSDFKVLKQIWISEYNKDNKSLETKSEDSFNATDSPDSKIIETSQPIVKGENEFTATISESQLNAIDALFSYVWTETGLNKEDMAEMIRFFENKEMPSYVKSQLISAMTLANIEYFNPEYFEMLLNVYETSDSLNEKARAIAGIVLISLIHSKRLHGNLRLKSRLIMNSGDIDFNNIVNDTILNIIRTYDTTRIDEKMRNEVIPGLMKMGPEIMEKFRNLSSDSEDFLSKENPDWEEIMGNSELSDKLQEINELQLEGADVMVTTFSQLKNFPFFNRISSWFLPFSKDLYLFKEYENLDVDEAFNLISGVMCDSDFYSFLLSMNNIGKERKQQTLKMMQNQIKEVKEAMSNSFEGESNDQLLKIKIRHSLQDLYRFFKYYKKKGDFKDPFGSPFVEEHFTPLIQILSLDTDKIRVVAEFYFKNKYYNEASGLFELIDSNNPGDFSIWEKVGFSHDKMQRYSEAAKWYHKAELVNPGSDWLIKKLALTLKNAGEYDEALKYFSKALEKEPENYHLLMSMGQCLLESDKSQEALSYFYHAQYLKPDKKAPQRAVAWAELLSGNLEKAEKQYEKILIDARIDREDILNAAHTSLASGNFKKALKLYKEYVEISENNEITSLVVALRDDARILRKLNIKTSDLRLIVDKIRYDLFD